MTGKLNIVVAFPAEARFFLDKYRLTLIKNPSKFPVYVNKEGNIHLIVSGLGKIKSAAAVGYIHVLSGGFAQTTYLNAGIAGALNCALGDIFIAHKIMDINTGIAFYPFVPAGDILKSIMVYTLDKPALVYPENALVEMEAAGFHAAALNMVTHEQIQTLKIVSDNVDHQPANIIPAKVLDLFVQNELLIGRVIDFLLSLSHQEAALHQQSPVLNTLLEHCHFTQFQRYQLQELLRRWQVNFPQKDPLLMLKPKNSAQEIIKTLNQHLAEAWI
jgi:nucleoside phosphorylase